MKLLIFSSALFLSSLSLAISAGDHSTWTITTMKNGNIIDQREILFTIKQVTAEAITALQQSRDSYGNVSAEEYVYTTAEYTRDQETEKAILDQCEEKGWKPQTLTLQSGQKIETCKEYYAAKDTVMEVNHGLTIYGNPRVYSERKVNGITRSSLKVLTGFGEKQ